MNQDIGSLEQISVSLAAALKSPNSSVYSWYSSVRQSIWFHFPQCQLEDGPDKMTHVCLTDTVMCHVISVFVAFKCNPPFFFVSGIDHSTMYDSRIPGSERSVVFCSIALIGHTQNPSPSQVCSWEGVWAVISTEIQEVENVIVRFKWR